jgi:hypothetical protein
LWHFLNPLSSHERPRFWTILYFNKVNDTVWDYFRNLFNFI